MVFRGWIVVAAVHAALFVVFGAAYSFAAFFTAFEREFGAGRGEIALIFSICGFLYFAISPFTGQLADRFGPRPVALAGMAFLAGGLWLASRAESLTTLYLAYGIGVGLGVGFVYVPVVGAIQPWFIKLRGRATGFAVAGIGLGGILGPVIAGALIPLTGWRGTFVWYAIGGAIIGGLACVFLDNNPARHGLGPDGARAVSGSPLRQVPRGITLAEALREPSFWLLYGAIVLSGIGLFVPFVHLLPYARDAGLSEADGIALTSLIGLGSLIGRFALGGIADRFPRRTLLAAIFVAMGLMLIFWLGSGRFTLLAIFAIVFGSFYGAFVALGPSIGMDLYGARNVGGILGALYSGAGIGNLIGPWLAGEAYDYSKSYTLPILIGAGCMFAAAGLAIILRRQPSRAEAA